MNDIISNEISVIEDLNLFGFWGLVIGHCERKFVVGP